MASKSMTKTSRKSTSENLNGLKEDAGQKLAFFPKIFRFITERWKSIISGFASGLILIAIGLQSLSLYQNLQEQKRIQRERGEVEKELQFWKSKLNTFKDHRDIYFKIATLEYRLGHIDEARINLQKTLEIDPNFENGRKFEKEIGL